MFMLLINMDLLAQQRYELKKGDTVIIDGTEVINTPKRTLEKKFQQIKPVRSTNSTPDVVVEINHNYSGRGYTGGELAPNPSPISPNHDYTHICDHSHCISDQVEDRNFVTYMDLMIVAGMLLLGLIAYLLYLTYQDNKRYNPEQLKSAVLNSESQPAFSPNISPVNIHNHINYTPSNHNENYNLEDKARTLKLKEEEPSATTDKDH